MADASPEQDTLKEPLAILEECLETPVVPGEAVDWVSGVLKSLQTVAAIFSTRVASIHREQLQEIAAQDDGLLTRVDELRENDRAIESELAALTQRVEQLVGGVEKAEPNEAKAEPALEKVAAAGLDLVIRIRKQEVALSTWLVEAFQRDRGTAD